MWTPKGGQWRLSKFQPDQWTKPSKTSLKKCCRACIQFTDRSYEILCRITEKAVRVKRVNEFAEWHVAWAVEWHNCARCNICRMTQRNQLKLKECLCKSICYVPPDYAIPHVLPHAMLQTRPSFYPRPSKRWKGQGLQHWAKKLTVSRLSKGCSGPELNGVPPTLQSMHYAMFLGCNSLCTSL